MLYRDGGTYTRSIRSVTLLARCRGDSCNQGGSYRVLDTCFGYAPAVVGPERSEAVGTGRSTPHGTVRFDLDRAATRARGVQIFSPRLWNRCESQRRCVLGDAMRMCKQRFDTAIGQAARTATGAWDGRAYLRSRAGRRHHVRGGWPLRDAPRRPCGGREAPESRIDLGSR